MRRTIYVENLRGERIIPVYVYSEELKNMTVREFRRRVDLFGPREDYILISRGTVLEDHRKLRDYGIESTVRMIKRLTAGERRTINVQIRPGNTIPVDVDSEELLNMTVEEFKIRFGVLADSIPLIQCEDYRLLYRGMVLKDQVTLRDYGIEHESTVYRFDPEGGKDSVSL